MAGLLYRIAPHAGRGLTMASDPSHLVERVAERLRGVGGLSAPEPAAERDRRRIIREDASVSRCSAAHDVPRRAEHADDSGSSDTG